MRSLPQLQDGVDRFSLLVFLGTYIAHSWDCEIKIEKRSRTLFYSGEGDRFVLFLTHSDEVSVTNAVWKPWRNV